ncbi:MFS transporter [Loktanella sp. S4079]|uniref:MFS transporter n=1 Tax=Loktanella sp. S4079 TaxID=579483 RepID=UPI0005F9DA96|nr:MFS transporter [Loktanella sp. S4079]KJZ18477.1 hypothetical protein TW80_13625 [Loktanella sp. S4079]
MGPWFDILRRHRVMRASAAAVFLYGFSGAATSPYQSIVAIRELGMSDGGYAMLALCAAIANVVMAIGVGMISDHFQSYRKPLIFVSCFGVVGFAAVWATPSILVFSLAMLGPLALYHAMNSMLFGNVRAHSNRFDPEESRIANALMRIMISLSWVLMPGAVGLLLANSDTMIAAYLIAALVAFGIFLTVTFWLEPDVNQPSTNTGPRPPAFRDLKRIVAPNLLWRVLGVALISQVLHVNAAVLPLVVTGSAQGETSDVGFLVGIVAVLEVIFMVFWTRATRDTAITSALMICATLYLGYLGALAIATAPWHVYLASCLAGFAAAGIVSLPISYLLDLISDRPGLSASLLAVNVFLGGGLGAGVFGIGTTMGGYGTAAILSGVFGCIGAGLLILVERQNHEQSHA